MKNDVKSVLLSLHCFSIWFDLIFFFVFSPIRNPQSKANNVRIESSKLKKFNNNQTSGLMFRSLLIVFPFFLYIIFYYLVIILAFRYLLFDKFIPSHFRALFNVGLFIININLRNPWLFCFCSNFQKLFVRRT